MTDLYNLINKDLLKKNERYLLAFSGGPDSVFGLLQIVKIFKEEFKYTDEEISNYLLLIYINYHDSPYVDKEQEIVEYYCKKFKLNKIFVMEYDCVNAANFEDAARVFRYTTFREVALFHQCDATVIFEHLNDYYETYYLQKERKSIVDYYGLKEENFIFNNKIIRPFLKIKKSQIIQFCKDNGYKYYDDPTNNSERKRNVIRKDINLMSDEELLKLQEEINQANLENDKLKEIVRSSFLENNVFSFEKISDDFDEETKEKLRKRIIYRGIKNANAYKEKYILSLVNDIYYLTKGKFNGKINLDEFTYLLVNKNRIQLVSSNNFFVYLMRNKYERYTDQMNSLYFHPSSEFKKCYKLDVLNPCLTNVYSMKTKPNLIKMKSKLKGENLYEFFKKQGFPLALIDIYPIIIDDDRNCIFVPRFDELFTDYIYVPYMEKYRDLVKIK